MANEKSIIDKIVADMKYYLDINEEKGVVYIPKFVVEKWIAEQEQIEVIPHAKWEYKSGPYGVAYCSNCNHVLEDYETNYCPDCGAKMDKE